MPKQLNIIERATLARRLQRNQRRLDQLESLLSGIPLRTVKFADLAITDAKIKSVEADKITAGIISVLTQLGGSTSDNTKIELDGENIRIILYKDNEGTANPQIVITI